MYKQIIIVRRDLEMSTGKLSGQVAHAAMAFLTNQAKENARIYLKKGVRKYPSRNFAHIDGATENLPCYYERSDLTQWAKESYERGENYFYTQPVDINNPDGELRLCESPYVFKCTMTFTGEVFDQWINGSFTKIVLGAKNKNHLLKAKTIAEELGMAEGKDFFLIKDNCLTDLEPEEIDENGVGRTLTCIGFAPMDSEVIDKISKKYQLLK